MKHSLIYLVTMGKFFLMKDDMKGQHYAIYKKEKQYLDQLRRELAAEHIRL